MSHIGTRPPRGENESCIELTEPLEAAVVAEAQTAEFTMPRRVSFPSMFPPGCTSDAVCWIPSLASAGLRACSADAHITISGTRITTIAARSAHPGRLSPTIFQTLQQ